MSFGERLHDAMLAAGIESSGKLAKHCGVSRQTVINWLKDAQCEMSAAHLMVLCRVLNVRPRWLCEGDEPVMRHASQALELLAIFESLSAAKAALWVRWGYRLARQAGLRR